MNKKKIELENIKDEIRAFYDAKKYHFLTINGILIDENTIEIQWIFSAYGAVNENYVFYTFISPEETLVSIEEIIPSAIMSQREVADMFGIEVEQTQKGLYLDEDSMHAPLREG